MCGIWVFKITFSDERTTESRCSNEVLVACQFDWRMIFSLENGVITVRTLNLNLRQKWGFVVICEVKAA
jgi:hypothetical protein